MKERLDYARQLRRETGQDIPTGEDLPRYEARESTSAAGPSSQGGASQGPASQLTPDEPPPDYEEAQAQAVGIRLEEQLREAAERQ